MGGTWGNTASGKVTSAGAGKGGWGNTAKGPPTAAAAPHKSGGGHGVLGALEGGAHFVAKKTELAGRDIKGIPGGVFDQTKTGVQAVSDDLHGRNKAVNKREWHDIFHGHFGRALHEADKGDATPAKAHSEGILRGLAVGVKTAAEHPLRDPFQTALLATTAISGAGSVGARAAAAKSALADGATAADVARAAFRKPAVQPRLIRHGDTEVPLQPSKNHAVRAGQAVHDKVIQHALDTNPDSRLGAYATKRIGGSLDETARRTQRLRDVPAQMLDKAAKSLSRGGKGRVEQAAMELTSTQTLPEAAAHYHEGQAAKGVNADMNRAVARLYREVGKRGMVVEKAGRVVIDEGAHPDLARADAALARVQEHGDTVLTEHEVRSPEALAASRDAPGRYRAGAEYVEPTPGRLGKPSQTLLKARTRVARLESLHEKAIARSSEKAVPYENVHTRTGYRTVKQTTAPEKALQRQHVEVAPGPRTPGVPSDLPPRGVNTPTVERLGSALSVAREELQRLETTAAKRVTPTGIVGGDQARPGRGFVSYKSDEPKASKSPAAGSPGPIVNEAKPPVTSHANKGENIAHGRVPNNITGQAARHYRQIVRFQNTADRRTQAIETGDTVRRTSRDVLVKVPGETHGKVTSEINEMLGRRHVNVDDINGLNAALDAYREDLVPGIRDKFATDRNTGIGTKAPDGYRWVDKNVLGDLARVPAGPRGRVARSMDNINSAVTAATVYFKIGHVATRVFTNAATNIIQGSAMPRELGRSVELWHALSEEDRARALAAAGQHGFQAMPHEGQSRTSRVATRGANWWAKHADVPFRFNSIAYEARKAGFDTPDKFREMLDAATDPASHGLNAAQAAKIDWVLKRANREQIAYDRLSETERRYITRAVWFYPWLAGATRFSVNTVLEHPYKAGALAVAGQHGREQLASDLGDVPTYESGLINLAGGDKPLVTDMSTFSPFSTPADVLFAGARSSEMGGFLNPAYASINSYVNGINQYGEKSKSPLKDALTVLVSPTPETQVVTGYLNRNKSQGKRMFPQSRALYGTASPLVRALVGPATPRRYNPAAGRSSAAKQRAGR